MSPESVTPGTAIQTQPRCFLSKLARGRESKIVGLERWGSCTTLGLRISVQDVSILLTLLSALGIEVYFDVGRWDDNDGLADPWTEELHHVLTKSG